MSKNIYLAAFSQAGSAATENVRRKLREAAESYAKDILRSGLEALVALHNKDAVDPSRLLRVLPVRDENFGVGYAALRINESSSNKYPPESKKSRPVVDLRVKRAGEGLAVLKVKYNDAGKATGFDHLARLEDNKLPLLDPFDKEVIVMAIECELEGVNCPNGRGGQKTFVPRKSGLGAGLR